ncbi:MAG: HEAT repeat domain-containing protein, partial [Myxococcales bacterium]|nr:HEAT repeat domain-containing protein [Myxococcales bacterium]
MLSLRLAALLAALSLVTALPSSAQAQSRREKLLKLLSGRPKGMSVDTWREQRREAARELGRLKERRAVPTLLSIIAKERFDVILEIAIDSLGEIGDKRAIGPLRKLLGDPSLDSYVRDAAAGALKKLRGGGSSGNGGGRKPKGGGHGRKPKGGGGSGKPKGGNGGGGSTGDEKKDPFGKLVELKLPELAATEIARVTQIDIVAGNGALSWDAASQLTTAGFSLAARYLRQHERRALGYTIDAATDFAFTLVDPPGEDATWTLGHNLRVFPEIRAYPFGRDVPKLFGQISAGFGYGLALSQIPAATEKRFNFNANVSIGGGPGYGRIIDIGQRIRLRRLAWVLRKAGLLAGEIDQLVGNKIIAAWYALRNNIGNFQQL